MHLPRGRFTDALVAFTVFVALLLVFPIGLAERVAIFALSPADYLAGIWRTAPLIAATAPLVDQFIQASVIGAAFTAVFLLIVGRFVERALGMVGMGMLFVAGAYAGAVARLVLTPLSVTPGVGAQGGLFALIAGYFMLYSVPRALPVAHHHSRVRQITALAVAWILLEIAFMLASGALDLSRGIIEPLGGFLAGLGLARPLLAWRYRRA